MDISMIISAVIVNLSDIYGLYFHRNISLSIFYFHWNSNTFTGAYEQHMAKVQVR